MKIRRPKAKARPGVPELIEAVQLHCAEYEVPYQQLSAETDYANARQLLLGQLVSVTRKTEHRLWDWLAQRKQLCADAEAEHAAAADPPEAEEEVDDAPDERRTDELRQAVWLVTALSKVLNKHHLVDTKHKRAALVWLLETL